MKNALILVRGIVQGVGFRPFVHNLAISLNLTGFVKNLGTSVEIVVEGKDGDVEAFIEKLNAGPKLSRIDSIHVSYPALHWKV